MIVFVCEYENVNTNTLEEQLPMELEFQVAYEPLTWVLRTESAPLKEQSMLFTGVHFFQT